MKKIVIFGLLALSICGMGCTATRTGIQQTQEPRAVTVADYTPSIVEVRKAIFSGVHAAKWRAQDRAPGLIYATNRWRGSLVTLAVDYTATTYTVLYKDSTDDDYSAESGNIPKDFPRWASFIAKNIDEKVALLGQEAQAQIRAFPRIAPALPGEPVTLEGKEDVDSFKLENRRDDSLSTFFDAQDRATVPVGGSQEQVKDVSLPKVGPAQNSTKNSAQNPTVEERELDDPMTLEQEDMPVAPAPISKEKKVVNPTPSQDIEAESAPKKMTTSATPLSSLTPLPTASSKTVDKAQELENASPVPSNAEPSDEQSVKQSPMVMKAVPVNLLVPEHAAPKVEQPVLAEEKDVKEQAAPPVQDDASSAASPVKPSEEKLSVEPALEPAPISTSPVSTSGPELEPVPVVKPQDSKAEDVPNVIRAIPVQLLVPQSQGSEVQPPQGEAVQDSGQQSSPNI